MKRIIKMDFVQSSDYRKVLDLATGKPDVAVKTPNLVIENQTGNSEIKSAKMIEQNFIMTGLNKLLQPEFLVQTYQKLKNSMEKEIHLKVN